MTEPRCVTPELLREWPLPEPGSDKETRGVVLVVGGNRGTPGAVDQLTRTVMAGSNPYSSHWKGKVSGLAMPPNEVVIKETDARQLVEWILGLDAVK